MKTLRNALLIGLAVFVLSPAGADDSAAAKKDLAQLQGEWSMVSGVTDGQPLPDQIRKQMKRVCQGNEVTTTMGVQLILKAKITVDPAPKPKTIDYEMTGGVNQGKTQLGIYELEGDTFRSCFSAPGDPRPTDFATKPDDHRTLTVWKRAKATAQPEPK
jgi:uncharacterized protein (TIGR03067 family)